MTELISQMSVLASGIELLIVVVGVVYGLIGMRLVFSLIRGN